jgi:hypothetical protein
MYNAREARNIADIYRTIIAKTHKQLDFQKSPVTSLDILAAPKEGVTSGYAIYIDIFFQGPVAVERGEHDKPIAYPTERAANAKLWTPQSSAWNNSSPANANWKTPPTSKNTCSRLTSIPTGQSPTKTATPSRPPHGNRSTLVFIVS